MRMYRPAGVYVETLDIPLRPIAGVSTAVAAFVGVARNGPEDTPTAVTSWAQFVGVFGPLDAGSFMAPAVQGYFLNGGERCFIVRTASRTVESFIGSSANDSGLHGLESVDDVTMIAVPDLMGAAGTVQADLVASVQAAMVSLCESRGDRMALLDSPADLSPSDVQQWRTSRDHDSSLAALYYPWIEVLDPASGMPRFVPPSGHVAGVWARTDAQRGVHAAPTSDIRGVRAVRSAVSTAEQDQLNPLGINTIRSFTGGEIRVWGARTLSSAVQWRYVPVRRLLSYLEKSILVGTGRAASEPSGSALWSRLRASIQVFLDAEWRNGRLAGARPADAYLVQCDETTHTAEDIAAGTVTCVVGVAPLRPGEFVLFTLSLLGDGTGIVIE